MVYNLHTWIVDANDNIIDWDFEDYKITKDLMSLTNEKCYEPFDTKKQIECASYIKSNVDKKKLIKGNKFDDWLDEFYYIPQFGKCFYNALAYKKHNPNCKIVFGKFGWRRKNGEPYWEYGESDVNLYKVDMNKLYNNITMNMKGLNKKQKIKYLKDVVGNISDRF